MIPILDPDSASYLNADPARAAGYPLFLRIVPLHGVAFAQGAIYAAASAWLARLQSRPLLAFALLVGFEELAAYHAHVLSESLFASSLTLWAAAATLWERERRLPWLILAGAFAGLACSMRPTGIALAAPLLLLAIDRPAAAAVRRAIAALAPLALIAAASWPASDEILSRAIYGKLAIMGEGQWSREREACLNYTCGNWPGGPPDWHGVAAHPLDFLRVSLDDFWALAGYGPALPIVLVPLIAAGFSRLGLALLLACAGMLAVGSVASAATYRFVVVLWPLAVAAGFVIFDNYKGRMPHRWPRGAR